MNIKDSHEIWSRYRNNTCTKEEAHFVEYWIMQYNAGIRADISEEELIKLQQEEWDKIKPIKRTQFIDVQMLRKVAAILLLFGLGFVTYLIVIKKYFGHANDISLISPAKDIAFLTLSDGTKVLLSDSANGAVRSNGIPLAKTQNGKLIYNSETDDGLKTMLNSVNSVTTPYGGKFQIVLSDGTKVWLNAGSKLSYPALFDPGNDRTVYLDGEAYFEVAKIKKNRSQKNGTAKSENLRFIVRSIGQEVEVLGTHFNINAYQNEEVIRTTLLEGSVRVTSNKLVTSSPNVKTGQSANSVVLKPNYQAALKNNCIGVSQANVDEVIAWKNGLFRFKDQSIEVVMRQLEKWYNVEVVYQGIPTIERFNGVIERSKSITDVLNILERTETVHFKIEGRRLTVMP
jgi:transmembrane sensor